MTTRRPFQLHVSGTLSYPLVEDGDITYGPLTVLKLEPGRILTVRTGITIAECTPIGKVVVSPADKYQDQLKFANNVYDSANHREVIIEISNLTRNFIRIETDDHLFKYSFVETSAAQQTDSVVDEVTVESESATQSEQVDESVVDSSPAEISAEVAAVVEQVAQPKKITHQRVTKPKTQKNKKVSI